MIAILLTTVIGVAIISWLFSSLLLIKATFSSIKTEAPIANAILQKLSVEERSRIMGELKTEFAPNSEERKSIIGGIITILIILWIIL